MKNSKNRKVWMLFLTVSLTLILIVLGYNFIQETKKGLYAEKLNYLMELSSKSAQNVKKQIIGDLSTINAIATFMENYKELNIEDAMPVLKREMDKKDFKRIGIIMPNGIAYSTDNMVFDFNDREYFLKAMNGESNVSDCLIDKSDGREINVYASPIYHGDTVAGVIFATKSQQQFSETIKIESFDGEGYAYIINSDGRPVVNTYNPNSVGYFENIFDVMGKYGINGDEFETIKTNIKEGRNGSLEFIRDDVRRQMCYSKIGINDWYIVSVVPVNIISMTSEKLVNNLTILTIAIAIFIAAVGVIMNKQLQRNNRKLEKVAYYDDVTGYSNLQKFNLIAKNLINQNANTNYAIVMLDVNKFKIINDIYGYEEGNNVLKFISETINNNISNGETFCRASSDNFNILMKYKSDVDIIRKLEIIRHHVNNYFDTYKIELIAGIYSIVDTSLDIKVLNDRANISKSIAKKQNEGWYHFFREENRLKIIKEKEIEDAMEKALQNEEFEVYFQPKYSLSDEKIFGAEALVRWNKADFGMISPIDFIPIFERNGFIRKLDLYMFEKVCKLMSAWKDNYSKTLVPISVNMSRVNLFTHNIAQRLKKISQKYDISPEFLEIELTESAMFADADNMIDIMTKIKNEGFLLSIDDFGSGYSSLSVIKNLPTDFVKIDKSFMDEAEKDDRGKKIVHSIVSMIKLLGITSVAEGVETESQIQLLKSAGCDIVQGYYYSKPVSSSEFEKMIENDNN